MTRWWLGLPPAQAMITCGEDSHRLRWEAGALKAIDHDDLEAESTLAALGGQRCECVEVVAAWGRHEEDPRVLVLASRGPGDAIAARADWTAQLAGIPRAAVPATPSPSPPRAAARQLLRRPGRRRTSTAAPRWTGHPPPASPAARITTQTQSETELVALLGLGGGLQDRLVATVAAAWAERFEHPDAALDGALAALHASMQGRLSAAMRSWLGRDDAAVELDLIDAAGAPSLTESEGVIRAELPFAWLPVVWSRGLAVVFGRFCLAAGTDDGRAWTLTTVGPELGAPAPLRLELPPAY
jgi:hypothetical protein